MIGLMKEKIGLIGGALSSLFLATSAFAGQNVVACGGPEPFKTLCQKNLGDVVAGFVNLAFIVALLIALVYLIYGGVKWMISGGDKSAVEEARNHVVAALVGLVIIFIAYFVINFLAQFLTGSKLSDLQVPRL